MSSIIFLVLGCVETMTRFPNYLQVFKTDNKFFKLLRKIDVLFPMGTYQEIILSRED